MRDDQRARLHELSPRAVKLWGFNKMLTKTSEECAELIVKVSKRVAGSPVEDEEIIDEICDVLVLVNRLRFHFGPEAVDARITYKTDRLERAIVTHEQTGTPNWSEPVPAPAPECPT